MDTYLMLISQNPSYFEAFLTKHSQEHLEEAFSSFSPPLGKIYLPLEMSVAKYKVTGSLNSF